MDFLEYTCRSFILQVSFIRSFISKRVVENLPEFYSIWGFLDFYLEGIGFEIEQTCLYTSAP